MNFIITQDSNTALMLRNYGLQELNKSENFFVFINNGKQNFSDNKNIIYTNKLSFNA